MRNTTRTHWHKFTKGKCECGVFRCLGLPGESCQRSTRKKYELCWHCQLIRKMRVEKELRLKAALMSTHELLGSGPIPSTSTTENKS